MCSWEYLAFRTAEREMESGYTFLVSVCKFTHQTRHLLLPLRGVSEWVEKEGRRIYIKGNIWSEEQLFCMDDKALSVCWA